jgi:hypothetical protein
LLFPDATWRMTLWPCRAPAVFRLLGCRLAPFRVVFFGLLHSSVIFRREHLGASQSRNRLADMAKSLERRRGP